jgi:hypothetical protein
MVLDLEYGVEGEDLRDRRERKEGKKGRGTA